MDELLYERLWGRLVANHRLTAGILPSPRAGDEALLRFAATFDGYVVRPVDMGDWVAQLLESYKCGERFDLSLTMARAALFGFARWEHHTGGYSAHMERQFAGCMQALVERIRELVLAREAGRRPVPGSLLDLEDGVMDAYGRFLEGYAMWGGHRFHGWTDFPDTHNFQGPLVWSEGDCALRFALELERVFPQQVHMEFAIGKSTRLDYEKDAERRQRVDLVVSDLSGFEEDETSQERFQTLVHGAFIEAKWLVKGWEGQRFERDATKRVASVHADIAKLARHIRLGRCQVAAALVVDDEDYFRTHSDQLDRSTDRVWRLVAGPDTLERHGLLHREWPPGPER
jgi:hypothetical protein